MKNEVVIDMYFKTSNEDKVQSELEFQTLGPEKQTLFILLYAWHREEANTSRPKRST